MEKLNRRSEEAVMTAVSASLAAQTINIRWEHSTDQRGDMDGEAVIRIDDRLLRLPYLVKNQIRPSTLGLLSHRLLPGTLILSDHITTSVGRLLRERGLSYADAAGNADIEAHGVRIHVEGLRPPRTSVSTTASLLSNSAMPLVLAVLNRPELINFSVRELQARTHVSVGTTHRVQKQLHDSGYVHTPEEDSSTSNRTRWRRLLEGWLTAFATMRDDITIGQFSSDLGQPELYSTALGLDASVSGEFAAYLTGADIRPATADFYVTDSASALIRAARLRRDPEGAITVRRAIWTPIATADSRHGQSNLAPSPVVYADIASIIDPRTERLAREWMEHDANLRSFIVD
ncbi:MAG: type IV toxin-antitoxin system AbiEi family antitoxin [Arachnia sp.]